jgi:ankyrin repeat protein
MTYNKDDEKLRAILKEYAGHPGFIDQTEIDVSTPPIIGDCPINIAAVRGSIEEIKIFIAYGADVNEKGVYDYTPLHEAVEEGHLEVVKFLLEQGADMSAKTTHGLTPLELAKIFKENEIFDLLLSFSK